MLPRQYASAQLYEQAGGVQQIMNPVRLASVDNIRGHEARLYQPQAHAPAKPVRRESLQGMHIQHPLPRPPPNTANGSPQHPGDSNVYF